MSKKILLVGESWMSFTTHVKGFDTFYTSVYETGKEWIEKAIKEAGYEFEFIPNHEAMDGFQFERETIHCFMIRDKFEFIAGFFDRFFDPFFSGIIYGSVECVKTLYMCCKTHPGFTN